MTRINKGSEFRGNIGCIRAIEDSIRATKKYTEGVRTMRAKHPMQGEEFASRVLYKHYEVYPDVDVSSMSLGVIIEWLSGYRTHLDVMFHYDYRSNQASMMVQNGAEAVRKLASSIPGFSEALAVAVASERRAK